MNALEIRAELNKLRSQVADLQSEQAPYREARAHALASERFNDLRQSDVDAANHHINRLDREISARNQRIDALSAQLPSEAQVAAAYARVQHLTDEVQRAMTLFSASASALAAECGAVTDAAQKMIEARRAVDAIRVRLTSERLAFGLEFAIPPAPLLPDAKLVLLTGAFLMQSAEGDPDANVAGELAQVRRPNGEAVLST